MRPPRVSSVVAKAQPLRSKRVAAQALAVCITPRFFLQVQAVQEYLRHVKNHWKGHPRGIRVGEALKKETPRDTSEALGSRIMEREGGVGEWSSPEGQRTTGASAAY